MQAAGGPERSGAAEAVEAAVPGRQQQQRPSDIDIEEERQLVAQQAARRALHDQQLAPAAPFLIWLWRGVAGDIWSVDGGDGSICGVPVWSGKDRTSPRLTERLATGALAVGVEHDPVEGRLLYRLAAGGGPPCGWVTTNSPGEDFMTADVAALTMERPAREELSALRLSKQIPCESVGLKCSRPQAAAAKRGLAVRQALAGKNRAAALATIAASGLPGMEATEPLSFPPAGCSERKRPSLTEGACVCASCGLPISDAATSGGTASLLHAECAAQLLLLHESMQEEVRQQREAAAREKRKREFDIGWKVDRIPKNARLAAKLGCDPTAEGMCCLVLDGRPGSFRVRVEPTVDPACAVNLQYLSQALLVRKSDEREPLFSLDPLPDTDFRSPMDERWQVKHFEPPWLQGMSAGEVMFQADVYLKELFMGEHEQPVSGMRSVFDYSWEEGSLDSAWNARVWFVIHAAEVEIGQGSILVPKVQMRVEAKQQVRYKHGLRDAPLTRSDHPMVKYAEAFSHHFDLIAERKSVIYHLRELAKATVLARFLWHPDIHLDDSWFTMPPRSQRTLCAHGGIPQLWNERIYSQIQVQRAHASALGTAGVADGEEVAGWRTRHGVYGGIDLQLKPAVGLAEQMEYSLRSMRMSSFQMALMQDIVANRLFAEEEPAELVVIEPPALTEEEMFENLQEMFPPPGAAPGAAAPPPPVFRKEVEELMVRMGRLSLAATRTAPLVEAAPLSRLRPAFQASEDAKPFRSALTQAWLAQYAAPLLPSVAVPQGVDLALPEIFMGCRLAADEGSLGQQLTNTYARDDEDEEIELSDVPVGRGFWPWLQSEEEAEEGGDCIPEAARSLLLGLFHPSLSDRRQEGGAFIPPVTQPQYLGKLRRLLMEEEKVRQQRREHFRSSRFSVEDAGPLFPFSWKPLCGVPKASPEGGADCGAPPLLHERPDYRTSRLRQILRSTPPCFARRTEDGVQFRIYRAGNLEVRTWQEEESEEVIGAVFSRLAAPHAMQTAEIRPEAARSPCCKEVQLMAREVGSQEETAALPRPPLVSWVRG